MVAEHNIPGVGQLVCRRSDKRNVTKTDLWKIFENLRRVTRIFSSRVRTETNSSKGDRLVTHEVTRVQCKEKENRRYDIGDLKRVKEIYGKRKGSDLKPFTI